MDKPKPITSKDIIETALRGGIISISRALASYADKNNWDTINDEKGCHWVWKGPTTCAYELAELAFKYSGN